MEFSWLREVDVLLGLAMIVLMPLGAWKVVEMIIWLVTHLKAYHA